MRTTSKNALRDIRDAECFPTRELTLDMLGQFQVFRDLTLKQCPGPDSAGNCFLTLKGGDGLDLVYMGDDDIMIEVKNAAALRMLGRGLLTLADAAEKNGYFE
jgi:hypothetical protein